MTDAEPARYLAATRAHAACLAALHAASARTGEPCWEEMAFDALLAGGRVEGLVACIGNAPCGFVLWRTAADESEILLIAVTPAFRRRGVGRNLLRRAVAAAQAAGAATMWLEVATDNPEPIALYRSEGFDPMARRRGYYHRTGGGRADALVFRRRMSIDGEVIAN